MILAETGRLLFAEEGPPRAFPFIVQGAYAAGALLVGAIIIAMVGRWRKRNADAAQSASDQLAHFRSLYEKGEIDQKEYDSLRRVLGGELRRGTKRVPHPETIQPVGEKKPIAPPESEIDKPPPEPPPANGKPPDGPAIS